MLTIIGGCVVVVSAILLISLKGSLGMHTGMLFLSGALLTVSGALQARRARTAAPRGGARGARATRGPITALEVLVAVAVLEVAVNRIAVPMLRPAKGAPPAWHTWLDYGALFLFYFTAVLAVLVLATRCVKALIDRTGLRVTIAHGLVGATTVIAAIPLVVSSPATLSLVLELAFGAAIVALVIAGLGRGRDLGVQFGLVVLAIPLLLHTVTVIGATFVWPENTFDGPGLAIARAGVIALSLAALASPYCFAPRPFARAVTRPAPVVIAMTIATVGAILARMYYPAVAKAASYAIGVSLSEGQSDPRLALYLLAIATLAWTLASCTFAASAARRRIGVGLALLLLGGYGFRWPHHYLLPLLGFVVIADAARRVREQELEALPLESETPPILDATWASYLTAVAHGLKQTLGDVHNLTTRGEGGLTSSVIVGDAHGIPVRVRVERIEGSVLALDVVLGREIDELRGSTLTMWAIAPRAAGANPPGPPAAPLFKTGDDQVDERFRTRGSAHAFTRLFDGELRGRAVATLDGWLAYWEGEGLRYRVYPGRGAPLDHPIPLSDLALGRGTTQTQLLVAVVELLVEIANRGLTVAPGVAPTEVDAREPAALAEPVVAAADEPAAAAADEPAAAAELAAAKEPS